MRDPRTVDQLTSTADGSVRLRPDTITLPPDTPPPVTGGDDAGAGPVIRVDPDARRQPFDGLGAALTDSSAWLLSRLPDSTRAAALRALFGTDLDTAADPDTGTDPDNRAGLSVVRLVIGSSDFARSQYTYDDSPTPDPDLAGFSIDHDRAYVIPTTREILAVNPEVQFVASPWSPPAWMKDSNALAYGSLLPEYEDTYADYLVRVLQAYRQEGIDIAKLTVQNEPQFASFTYPGMVMDASQQARFIADSLGPALARAGLDTEVLVYDHNWDDPDYPLDVLGHPRVRAFAAGTAFHCYEGDQASAQDRVHEAHPFLSIWVTECSGGEWQGSRRRAFFATSDLVIDGLNHWANATLLWNLALDADGGPHTGGCDTCRGVVTVDDRTGTWVPTLDFDVLAHVGRWAPPGSPAVPTTVSGSTRLETAALRTDRERIVLVVANRGPEVAATVQFGDLRIPVTLAGHGLVTLRWSA